MRDPASHPVVLYDGVCGFCNRGVQFLLERDRHDQLRFASLQSRFAEALLTRHGVDAHELDSIYVVLDYAHANERLLARSEAALRLIKEIGGVWRILSVLRFLPARTRDRLYDLVARHRYRIFGKHEVCSLPEARHGSRFLDG